jgi:hypothetical protein
VRKTAKKAAGFELRKPNFNRQLRDSSVQLGCCEAAD